MKKFILLLSLLLSVGVNAQNDNHIEFMGIPLGTTTAKFASKLIQKGFIMGRVIPELNGFEMKGNFLGVKNQVIGIGHTNDNIVNSVGVFYEYNTWNGLYNQYVKIKTMLTQKYKKPNVCKEYFLSPIPKDDTGKIQALKNGRGGHYLSVFNVKSGIIRLEICYSAYFKNPNVCLTYKDLSVKDRQPIDDL